MRSTGYTISASLFVCKVLTLSQEFIGSDTKQAQSNYFGKGNTTTYDRMEYHPVNIEDFHDYAIEWTPETVQWSIDGKVVRTLYPSQVKGDFYPQTPMQIKIGPWAGGDPKNQPGVVKWAQGPTDFEKGPFDMVVKSITIQDYSTGSYYYYSDKSGSASSIRSEGGKIMVGPSNDPPKSLDNDSPQSTHMPITTPRSPTSASGTEQGTTNNTKTTPLPTTTTYLSPPPTETSNSIHYASEPAGAGDATSTPQTSAPSGSSLPLETDGAGMGTYGVRLGVPVIMAIAGVVGMGLFL